MHSLVRTSIIIFCICLCCCSISGRAQSFFKYKSKHSEKRVSNGEVTTEDVLHYINQYRRRRGLPSLKMNDAASHEAEKHSRDMATRRTEFGHSGFDERMHRLMKELAPVNNTAENVAYGNMSAKAVVDLWIHSAGHRRNIEGNYNLTGIGIVADRHGTLYFTQIFLNKR